MVTRISRDEMLMEVAHVTAKRGTCSRLQVGAVISRDGRILVTGYNGAPAGLPHCTHEEFIWPPLDPDVKALPVWVQNYLQHVEGSIPSGLRLTWDGRTVRGSVGVTMVGGCSISEHAERNAIAFAAKHGIALDGSVLHCTDSPCLDCARSIINSGIRQVVFERNYRIEAGVELLRQAGLEVVWSGDPS